MKLIILFLIVISIVLSYFNPFQYLYKVSNELSPLAFADYRINSISTNPFELDPTNPASPIDPISGTSASDLIIKGSSLYDSGKYEEAIKYYDKALAIEPNNTHALYKKTSALRQLGLYLSALENIDKMLAIEPNDFVNWELKGITYYELEKYEEAIEMFDKSVAIGPNISDGLNLKAISLFELGRYEEAIKSLDKALAISPDDVFALNMKANILQKLEKYEEAITYFDKVLVIDPNDTDALNNKAVALDNLDKPDEAIQYYDKVLAIEPENVDALNNKGAALGKLGKSEEAIAIFDKVLELEANAKGVSYTQNEVIVDSIGYNENTGYSTKIPKIEPLYLAVVNTNTFKNLYNYDREPSRLSYVSLSKETEKSTIVETNKGIAFYNMERYQEAIAIFDKVLGDVPDYAGSLYYKYLCLEKIGKVNEAMAFKEKAAEADPTYRGGFITIVVTKSPLEQLFAIDK